MRHCPSRQLLVQSSKLCVEDLETAQFFKATTQPNRDTQRPPRLLSLTPSVRLQRRILRRAVTSPACAASCVGGRAQCGSRKGRTMRKWKSLPRFLEELCTDALNDDGGNPMHENNSLFLILIHYSLLWDLWVIGLNRFSLCLGTICPPCELTF